MHGSARLASAPEPVAIEATAEAEELVAHMLGGVLRTRAARVLAAATDARADPLDFCCARSGLGAHAVLARAAEWAGLSFCEDVPVPADANLSAGQLDSLGTLRVLRTEEAGQERFYLSPKFDELLQLRRRVRQRPNLAADLCVAPAAAIQTALTAGCGAQLLDESRQRLARRWPFACADLDLSPWRRIALVLGLALAVTAAALAPFLWKEVLLPLCALLLAGPSLIRAAAAFQMPEGPRLEAPTLADADLPFYSVLIPLRDEAAMVPMLGQAMAAIDYPPEKLEVLFVVEALSEATATAVTALLDDPRFRLVLVPDAPPRTKPKALNFALPLVRGTHLVVYDAEDIPEPAQLRRAAARFAAEPELVCLQAELRIDNADENGLTALFAGEYAGLFSLLLPLLGRWQLPMPLGGTSNHFRTAALRAIGGWDAFNVTEDADLGVRLARVGATARTLRSETAEEAPIGLGAWMRQRSRWVKGWMQTWIVHNRRPGRLLAELGWRNFLFFQVFVGGMILSSLLHSVFLIMLGLRLALGEPMVLDDGWDLACLGILVVGYGGSILLVLSALIRQRRWRLIAWQLLLPLYWVLHTLAAMRAAHELLQKPYAWSKTEHGRTRLVRGPAAAAKDDPETTPAAQRW